MRLIRFGERGGEKPGMPDGNGAARDLSGMIADIDGAALASGAASNSGETLPS